MRFERTITVVGAHVGGEENDVIVGGVLPPPGKTNYETRMLSANVWSRLGYVVLGPRACRVDLAERAAQALLDGASEFEAVRCLSIPRRDTSLVARAIRELSPPRVGAA